jgi:HSP20 family molecular chaperone IbpA
MKTDARGAIFIKIDPICHSAPQTMRNAHTLGRRRAAHNLWNGMNWIGVWRPPTDIYETEQKIIVRMEVAGMREEDFSIELREHQLCIQGVRSNNAEEPRAYHQMEIPWGEFAFEIELSASVELTQVEAHYQDGFLKIILPKLNPQAR